MEKCISENLKNKIILCMENVNNLTRSGGTEFSC
jgi:hypothetical protein